MPLRCLLFSSDEGLAAPIWQVLSDLGIDGEYCRSAVEAVERVTTQLFQIVITDWDDQPEAEFLLKTARDLKPAHRPLTLAIVKDDASLPLALQAGANSILRKPLAPEQVRDTLSTARDLLRAKLESSTPVARQAAATAAASAFAAAASAGGTAPSTVRTAPAAPVSVPASARASVTKVPEKAFRAGEFLQPASSDPGKQFDTEPDAANSLQQAAAAEVDPLGELEPMAAAVGAVPQQPQPEEPQPEAPMGWASVEARLTRLRQAPMKAPSAQNEFSRQDTHSPAPPAGNTQENGPATPATPEDSRPETKAEAELFAHIAGESTQNSEPDAGKPPNRMGRLLVVAALAAAGIVAVSRIPLAQQGIGKLYASAVLAGRSWLNPQTVSPPQAPTQHESFGQAGDEYKLPVARNIPDATTDSSQIRVLPVVDPTAKPGNGSAANGAQAPAAPADNANSEPNKPGQVQVTEQTSQNPGANVQPAAVQSTGASALPMVPAASASPVQTNLPALRVESLPQRPAPPQQSSPQPRPTSVTSNAAIPSSLKSQIASATPDASGTKPAEAALPSMQPVDLPESAARGLLVQQVEPVYPDSAKNSRQQGSVVLQVMISADGTVQDAKFLQGSLVFARAAIDAVRQWRFKPYMLNGRAASAQTVLTLNFHPPA
jgi:protein TonB